MACALSHMSSVLLVILTICFNHLNFSSENVKSKDWMELNRTLLKICILKIDGCKWWIWLDDTSKLKHTWMPPDALQSAAICGAEEIWFLSIILQFPMMHKRQRCTLRFPAASLNNGMSCDKEETVLFFIFYAIDSNDKVIVKKTNKEQNWLHKTRDITSFFFSFCLHHNPKQRTCGHFYEFIYIFESHSIHIYWNIHWVKWKE